MVLEVAVLGAGVLGTSVAAHLHAGGARVTLYDPAGPGGGTTARGAGLVTQGLWHETSLRLVQRSLVLLERLATPFGPLRFHRTGGSTLVPAALEDAARRAARFQENLGVAVEVLDPAAAARLPRHGGLRLDDAALVLHHPGDGWVLPRLATEILAHRAREAGLRFVRAAAGLRREGTDIVVTGGGGAPLAPDVVVVAAGISTRALLRQAGLDAPLLPYRTQAARFHHAEAEDLPVLHDAVQGCYLRPGLPRHVLIGNGTTTTPEDPDAWNPDADAPFLDASRTRLARRAPRLAYAAVLDAWAGLDAATPDRLLLAGPHPEAPRIHLLAGGNGHGFMRGLAAGEALADRILGRDPHVELAAFDPARFRGRMSDPFPIREGFSLEAPSLGGAP